MDQDRDSNSLLIRISQIGILFLLNIFWFLCSLPVFTLGAATAALHRVCLNMVAGCGNPLSDYWRYFRMELKQATILWLVLLLFGAFLVFDWQFILNDLSSERCILGIPILSFASIVYCIVLAYSFPLEGCFQNKLFDTIKNAVILGISHPLATVSIVALDVLPWIVVLISPKCLGFLLINVSLSVWLQSFILYRLYRLSHMIS